MPCRDVPIVGVPESAWKGEWFPSPVLEVAYKTALRSQQILFQAPAIQFQEKNSPFQNQGQKIVLFMLILLTDAAQIPDLRLCRSKTEMKINGGSLRLQYLFSQDPFGD